MYYAKVLICCDFDAQSRELASQGLQQSLLVIAGAFVYLKSCWHVQMDRVSLSLLSGICLSCKRFCGL